jgi:hypothetical protein
MPTFLAFFFLPYLSLIFVLHIKTFKFLAGVSKTIAAVAGPSEFSTDEDNIVNRSAMDALRYSKK